MNAEIKALFADYLLDAKDPVAAAVLALADMLSRPTPEPIVIESDDRGTLSVKEAAERLHTSSRGLPDVPGRRIALRAGCRPSAHPERRD